MNSYAEEELDAIFMLATAVYAGKLTDEFNRAKPDFEVSERTESRIMRMIRKEKQQISRKNTLKVLRFIAVACLIAATVAFSACMAIPDIREAMWKAVIDWHDEDAMISFEPAEGDSTYEQLSTAPSTTMPIEIEEVRLPSYMPEGCATTESHFSMARSIMDYYDQNGKFMFSFSQMVVEVDCLFNSEGASLKEMTVNGMSAVLITYEDDPHWYTLYWQDSQYRYSLCGTFEDYDQLIRMATSVKVE